MIYDKAGAQRNTFFIEALQSAAKAQGVNLSLLLTEDLRFGTRDGKLFIASNGKDLPAPNFVLCRTIFPLLTAHLEAMGIPVFHNSRIAEICNDKRRTHLFLACHGIPTPDTCFHDANRLPAADCATPVVVKQADGHGGKEVFLCEDAAAFGTARQQVGSAYLTQPLYTPGLDVRVYVSGQKILAAMERKSKGDFRSNFTLGGTARQVRLTEQQEEIVLKILSLLDFALAGIDFIFDENGNPLVNEMEDVVGCRMLYTHTEIDPAKILISHCINNI